MFWGKKILLLNELLSINAFLRGFFPKKFLKAQKCFGFWGFGGFGPILKNFFINENPRWGFWPKTKRKTYFLGIGCLGVWPTFINGGFLMPIWQIENPKTVFGQ